MVKCIHCGKDTPIVPVICPRKIAITKRTKIEQLQKELAKETETERKKNFQMIMNKVKEMETINTKEILSLMNWTGITDGDALLTFLDQIVCLGFLEKTRFWKGRPGHLYKNCRIEQCPYFIENKCNCPIELYRAVEEVKQEVENERESNQNDS